MKFGEYFEDIETLVPSSEASSKADQKIIDSEIEACTVLINTSVNCGLHECLYTHWMSDNLRSTLEGNGYTIEDWRHCAVPGEISLIKW